MMKKLHIALISALTIVSVNASAFSHEEAGKMQVQISNQTSSGCSLTNTDVGQGKLLSPAPLAIPQGDAKGFIAEQGTLRGSSIVLSYTCGDGKIKFRTHQHIVKATGSLPSATVLDSSGLDLSFDAVSSSVLHNKAGILNITLKD